MGERRALLIGVQNDRFGKLDFVPEVMQDLRAVVLDDRYGSCRPALPDGRIGHHHSGGDSEGAR